MNIVEFEQFIDEIKGYNWAKVQNNTAQKIFTKN